VRRAGPEDDPRRRWTLSGGGALAGVHTQHRTTRDLDLFYRDDLVEQVLAQVVPE
jgi:hypothetical protein